VDEYIRPIFASDESVALGVVKPLNLSFVLSHSVPFLFPSGDTVVFEGNLTPILVKTPEDEERLIQFIRVP
jgi:hypothetical protein